MIVSNTTPISNFLHLNRIDILQKMFDQIHIPHAVQQEVDAAFSHHSKWQECLNDEFFAVRTVKSQLLIQQLLAKLHLGEAEVLSVDRKQQKNRLSVRSSAFRRYGPRP